jgi:3-hydroxybutyryl-CoA dehydrogenase
VAEIRKVGVLGCGLMGHGITEVAAQAGYPVVVREVDEATLAKGLQKIEQHLARAVQRERLTQEAADEIRARIEGTTDYAALAGSDLVIEAITEDLELKLEMWTAVDAVVEPAAFFATNTSSLPVIAQAAATGRSERFLGLHFFKDKAGFIVNRLLVPYLLDGMRAYEEGVGSISQIDAAMQAGAGHPMGPMTLSDFIGLDTLGAICDAMFDEFRERRFAQPPMLRKMLAARWYGRKSGMGFYDYSGAEPVENPGLAS